MRHDAIGEGVFLFFFFLMTRPPPRSTLFPYTTLFRSRHCRRSSATTSTRARCATCFGTIRSLRSIRKRARPPRPPTALATRASIGRCTTGSSRTRRPLHLLDIGQARRASPKGPRRRSGRRGPGHAGVRGGEDETWRQCRGHAHSRRPARGGLPPPHRPALGGQVEISVNPTLLCSPLASRVEAVTPHRFR